MTTPLIPPYTPAAHLIKSSNIAAEDLIRCFQGSPPYSHVIGSAILLTSYHEFSLDFYLSLEYIPAAPTLVFERIMANAISSKDSTFSRQPLTYGQGPGFDQDTATVEEYRNENKILRLENDRLKAVLETSRSLTKLPRPSSSPRVSQGIGTFHTQETANTGNYTKDISFSNTYSASRAIAAGLREVDIYLGSSATRVNIYATNIQRTGFKIHIDGSVGVLYSGCVCSTWLEVAHDDPDFQVGAFSTQEDQPYCNTGLGLSSRRIIFTRAYDTPPQVVVWLTEFQLGYTENARIRTWASDITATGFTLRIDNWDKTMLYAATASWVACTADKPNVCTGTFKTYNLGNFNGGFTQFENGCFTTLPRVLLAISSFEITTASNIKLLLLPSSIDATGITWGPAPKNDYIDSVGGSFIALG